MSLKAKERKVQLPVQTIRAEFAPASFNKDKRTIDLVWSVGAKGLRGYYDPYYEQLDMDPASIRMGRMESGNSPFLDAHESWSTRSVLGVVTAAKIENGVGTCTVRLADPETIKNPDAQDTIRKIEAGILKNISVGYNVYRYERQPAVEGEEYPTYRAMDWEPMEVSIVPIGFDESAVVRGNQRETVPCVFSDPQIPNERNKEVTTMTEEQKKALELEQRQAAEKAEKEKADLERAVKAAAAAEKARAAKINEMVSAVRLPDTFAKAMIDGDKTVEQARELVIAEMARKSSEQETVNASPSITAGKDGGEKWREGAGQWLMQRAGGSVGTIVESHHKVKLDGGEFRGMSLIDIARESLERQGIKTRGMDKMKMVGLALTHRSGMNTSGDFAVLLENTLHKILLASYGTTPDTWNRFCARGSVSDFRAHNRYRQGTFGSLSTVLEGAEFVNKQIPDGVKNSITAVTKGNIIALSRQAIINDDMGAFNSLAMQLGRAAKLSVEVDVYALLALNSGLGPTMSDSLALFDAGHSNISTGAALSAAAIDADRVKMASQLDPSGNEVLDLRPAILLVPVGLGGVARIINTSQYDPDTVANKAQMKPNVVAGLFRDVVDSPRFSGTRRYLFADPSIAPVIEVAFLDGQSEPFMDSEEGFRTDGVEWKVRLDYGVGAVDTRGAVTNAGA